MSANVLTRETIAREVIRFFANGGKVQRIPTGVVAYDIADINRAMRRGVLACSVADKEARASEARAEREAEAAMDATYVGARVLGTDGLGGVEVLTRDGSREIW